VTMPTERSITPGRKALAKTYRLPEDLYLAAASLSDLFHAGTLTRVAEDAVSEQLIELGYLTATKKAAVFPQRDAITTDAAVLSSLEDIRELLEAMHGRLRSTSTSRFVLRQSTLKALKAALSRWPNVPEWKPQRPRKGEHEHHPIKLHIHPRTQIALDEWVETLKTQYPDASLSKAIHIAIRAKCERVGLDPLQLWRERGAFTTPVFTRFPHPDATWDTRSLEERAVAITMALEVLGAAVVEHKLSIQTLPSVVQDSVDRLMGALSTTTLEE
jgi:hypothetical protein